VARDFAAPPRKLSCHAGLSFRLYALAVEEAINGAGAFLMGMKLWWRGLIDEGRLVRPFPQRAPHAGTLRIWSDAPCAKAVLRTGCGAFAAPRLVAKFPRRDPTSPNAIRGGIRDAHDKAAVALEAGKTLEIRK